MQFASEAMGPKRLEMPPPALNRARSTPLKLQPGVSQWPATTVSTSSLSLSLNLSLSLSLSLSLLYSSESKWPPVFCELLHRVVCSIPLKLLASRPASSSSQL